MRAGEDTSFDVSYKEIKRDIKENLPTNVATKIISELTDENLMLFLEDYLNERVTRNQSFDPMAFYSNWKQMAGVKSNDAPANDPIANLEQELEAKGL